MPYETDNDSSSSTAYSSISDSLISTLAEPESP